MAQRKTSGQAVKGRQARRASAQRAAPPAPTAAGRRYDVALNTGLLELLVGEALNESDEQVSAFSLILLLAHDAIKEGETLTAQNILFRSIRAAYSESGLTVSAYMDHMDKLRDRIMRMLDGLRVGADAGAAMLADSEQRRP